MSNKKKYDIEFNDALNIVIRGGAIKGDDFANGIYIKLNHHGQLVTVDVNRMYTEDTFVSLKGLYNQKFRVINVATSKELNY